MHQEILHLQDNRWQHSLLQNVRIGSVISLNLALISIATFIILCTTLFTPSVFVWQFWKIVAHIYFAQDILDGLQVFALLFLNIMINHLCFVPYK